MPASDDTGYVYGIVRCVSRYEKRVKMRDRFGVEFYVPRKQVHDNSEVWKPGQTGKLVVTELWAKHKKWI